MLCELIHITPEKNNTDFELLISLNKYYCGLQIICQTGHNVFTHQIETHTECHF